MCFHRWLTKLKFVYFPKDKNNPFDSKECELICKKMRQQMFS